ncbi:MAG: hypothetical protein PUA84_07920 [Oscillospiraceae bacterium]|nr:hypothetical protein [Oscillospiraceae bacterium]
MKKIILITLCALALMLSCPLMNVSAAGENSGVASSTAVQSEQTDEDSSKGRDIAVFLIIFTIAMGTTAIIVARPKLKKLREVRSESDNTNQKD